MEGISSEVSVPVVSNFALVVVAVHALRLRWAGLYYHLIGYVD